MFDDLKGKTALVTGAASGIGRAAALRFADEGMRVALSDLNESGLKAVAAEARARGAEAMTIIADVAAEGDVKQMVSAAIETFGKLDVTVNNAGLEPTYLPLHDISLEAWERVISVNLRSAFLCMKYELLEMRKAGSGSIINISSIGAVRSGPQTSDYAAAKRGVLAATSVAALENAGLGIRINAVLPGVTDTAMTERADANVRKMWEQIIPMGTIAEADWIANAISWLASDQSSYVTGQSISVCGGVTA